MTAYTLHLGNKAYSSWSLRGWLLFSAFGIPFAEKVTPMYTPEFEQLQKEVSPSYQVPTLLWTEGASEHVVWDTLAIAELLAERHPEAGHWPADPIARAAARCLAAEMHSSFRALRSAMPMNLKKQFPGKGRSEDVDADINRVFKLWTWARERFGDGGPYLFGPAFTAADAFFVPVALRFETYDVKAPAPLADTLRALQTAPTLEQWRVAADAEPWVEARYDVA